MSLKNKKKNNNKNVIYPNVNPIVVGLMRFYFLLVPKYKLDAPIVKSSGYNAVVLMWLSAPTATQISGYKVRQYLQLGEISALQTVVIKILFVPDTNL